MSASRLGRRSGGSVSGVGAGVGLGLAVLSLTAMAQAQAAWVGTASKTYGLLNAVQLGALPDTAPMHVAVGLKLQNEAQLDQFLQRAATPLDRNYGAALSQQQFMATYAPSAARAQAVADYLSRAGFSNVQIAPNRLLVTADARRPVVETAFNTRILQYRYGGRTVFANSSDAQIPAALGDVVQSVLGLQNADLAQPMIEYPAASTQASVKGIDPAAFPVVYDAGSTATGAGTTVGIIAEGDLTQVVTDLRTFESQNALPQVALQFVPAMVNGTDTSGLDEWDLDSQSSTGIAGTVQTLYFFNAASLADADLAVAYNNAAGMAATVKAVNVSLGICEKSPHSSGAMATDDAIFKAASAQGQTFFVSSGDGGAKTGCSGHTGLTKQVSYPASSPYVVAVGGTTLSTNADNTWAGETAWSGSGGGVSVYEAAPSWQKALTGSSAREVPDVAMDADPNSGAVIVVNGAATQVGGTSLAAPLSVGTWARVESAHANALTFAAPSLYAANSASPFPYHDVTSGSNGGLLGGGYSAKVGYDEVTGLGTFDIAKFNSVVH